MENRIISWKSLFMTLKIWNYGFTLIFIWALFSFCLMLWNIGINLSFVFSAIVCSSVFIADWIRCKRKICSGIKELKSKE